MVSVVEELQRKAEEREEERVCVTEDCTGDPVFVNGLCVKCMLKVSQRAYQRERCLTVIQEVLILNYVRLGMN